MDPRAARHLDRALAGMEEDPKPARPQMAEKDVLNLLDRVIKMAVDNKISKDNAWQLELIEYMPELVRMESTKEQFDFQKTSWGLQASVAIYDKRVESTHATVFQTLHGIKGTKSAMADDGEEGDDTQAAAGDQEQPTQGSRRSRRAAQGDADQSATLADPESLRQKKAELTFDADPLFTKNSKLFDEANPSGLLLLNVPVFRQCDIMFHSHDQPLSKFSTALSPAPEHPDVQLDLSGLGDFLSSMLTEAQCSSITPSIAQLYKQLEERQPSADVVDTECNAILMAAVDELAGDDDSETMVAMSSMGPGATVQGAASMSDSVGGGAVPMEDDADDAAYGGGAEHPVDDFVPAHDEHEGDDLDVGGCDDDDDVGEQQEEAEEGAQHADGLSKEAHAVLENLDALLGFDQSAPPPMATSYWKFPKLSVGQRARPEPAAKKSRQRKQAVVYDIREMQVPESMMQKLKKGKPRRRATSTKKKLLPDVKPFPVSKLLRLEGIKPTPMELFRQDIMAKRRPRPAAAAAAPSGSHPAASEAPGQRFEDDAAGPDTYGGDDDDFGYSPADDGGISFEDLRFGQEADPLSLDNLLPVPRRVQRTEIKFDREAKQVDVRLLKETIHKSLLDLSGPATGPANVPDKSAEMSFKEVITHLPADNPAGAAEDISVHLCFICLLHLANENGLSLTTEGRLDMLKISGVPHVGGQ